MPSVYLSKDVLDCAEVGAERAFRSTQSQLNYLVHLALRVQPANMSALWTEHSFVLSPSDFDKEPEVDGVRRHVDLSPEDSNKLGLVAALCNKPKSPVINALARVGLRIEKLLLAQDENMLQTMRGKVTCRNN